VRLCVFEDVGVANLEPLSLTRPAFDLWLGAGTLLSRLQRVFSTADVGAIVRPSLANLCRQRHPEIAVNDADWLRRGPVLFVNARWLPSTPAMHPVMGEVGLTGEQLAFAAVPSANLDAATPDHLMVRLTDFQRAGTPRPIGGAMLNYPWDLVTRNAEALGQDYLAWQKDKKKTATPFSIVGPRDQVVVDPKSTIEPQVLLDTTRGPILIDRGAVVQAFSRLEGPCYVGQGTQILGARLRGGSIGPMCRIGGEVESSVVLAFSNKYHDGFLGHSYVGEWVNFGAGSQTSDLRTDYGPIIMSINGAQVPTGLMKIGSYLGDHTRMSINTLLNTGTVVGPFGLLLTSGTLLPRVLPAFCRYGHGRVEERTDLGQMFETAATVMARRGQEWTDAHAEFFFDLYEQTAGDRARVLRENEQHRLRRVV
jgi:UDP-N-acetylglucosamine diphosphorylase/glucosamine-1-phosphate N-acetyltransferase